MQPYTPIIDGQQTIYANGHDTIQSMSPATGEVLPDRYVVSGYDELKAAVAAGKTAAAELALVDPNTIADFLELYATNIEDRSDEICNVAALETALLLEARLKSIELPRTTTQLRQAAAAVRSRDWTTATIDSKLNIRSMYRPLSQPVLIFGPNNFPLAYNAIAGGDFAAAIAAGNPVICKAHPGHLSTTRLLAEAAQAALADTGLPAATIQLFYHCTPEDGLKLAAHPGIGAIGFTGSRRAGLALKQAADSVGTPIYLEMSSVNPIFMLPGALAERGAELAGKFAASCTLATGQFCTNPGLIVVPAGDAGEAFLAEATAQFEAREPGTLLSQAGASHIEQSIAILQGAGAKLVSGGAGAGATFDNTLLRVSSADFLAHAEALQTEAFGPVSLIVFAKDLADMIAIADSLQGNLTGGIYSHRQGEDDAAYDQLAPVLRPKVGRLLNDKMPTGVALTSAMVHGGPYPSTGHPGFTAVGIPASIHRFAALQCYDYVRPERLPLELRDKNPTGAMWRLIDDRLTQGDVGS